MNIVGVKEVKPKPIPCTLMTAPPVVGSLYCKPKLATGASYENAVSSVPTVAAMVSEEPRDNPTPGPPWQVTRVAEFHADVKHSVAPTRMDGEMSE